MSETKPVQKPIAFFIIIPDTFTREVREETKNWMNARESIVRSPMSKITKLFLKVIWFSKLSYVVKFQNQYSSFENSVGTVVIYTNHWVLSQRSRRMPNFLLISGLHIAANAQPSTIEETMSRDWGMNQRQPITDCFTSSGSSYVLIKHSSNGAILWWVSWNVVILCLDSSTNTPITSLKRLVKLI